MSDWNEFSAAMGVAIGFVILVVLGLLGLIILLIMRLA